MFKKISIIGAGSWGTALAILLAEHRGQVLLWAHNPKVVDELVSRRTNTSYLPGLRLPPNVYATGDLAETTDADMIVFVTPSKATREVATALAAHGLKDGKVVESGPVEQVLQQPEHAYTQRLLAAATYAADPEPDDLTLTDR